MRLTTQMLRNINYWVYGSLDVISHFNKEEIEKDKQISRVRCRIHKNIWNNITNLKEGKPLNLIVTEELFYYVVYKIHKMYEPYNYIPEDVAKIAEPYKDLYKFSPSLETLKDMIGTGVAAEFIMALPEFKIHEKELT